MTVSELIKVLEKMPKDSIVVITDHDRDFWDNVGRVYEDCSTVKIEMDNYIPFED